VSLFLTRTATLPHTTEVERLVIQRVRQDICRASLLDYWQGACALTGLAVPELLRASHIKPLAACTTDAERLNVFNGLLLAPHLDAAFDRGFITLDHDGHVLVSDALHPHARRVFGLDKPHQARSLAHHHRAFLEWYQERLFRA
jgi:putative restriction endonuclease